MTKPSLFSKYPVQMRMQYGPYMAVVDYIRDADTVVVAVDVGLKTYVWVAVRLKNVKAPELDQIGGPETRDFVNSLIPHGTPVTLHTNTLGMMERWNFDRVVGELALIDNTLVNSEVQAFVDRNGYGPGRDVVIPR